MIVGAVALIATGTISFLSDAETSVNNVFTAGAIDLEIDNECHYNGMVCTGSVADGYFWVEEITGQSSYPELIGEACTCTWEVADWTDGTAFFEFDDVKPGDEGEDTISLHIDSNPAWVCAEIVNVEQFDNGCNSPELKAEIAAYGEGSETCGVPGEGEGELWENLFFSFWMDTGDGEHACNNIKDADETYIIEDINIVNLQYPVVDSQTGGEPIREACIGVSWYVPFDVNNIAQTDSVTGDVVFTAYQARHNEDFVCFPPDDPICGNEIVEPGETCELPNTADNTYCDQSSSQCVGPKLQTRDSFGDCDLHCGCIEDPWSNPVCDPSCDAGCVSDADCYDGNPATTDTCDLDACTCDNTEMTGNLTVIKVVENPGDLSGALSAGNFQMTIDGNNVNQGQAYSIVIGNHIVSEVDDFGYTVSYSAECPGGIANVSEGADVTCTVTNTVPYYTITVTKEVVNTPWNGNNVVADFPLFVGGQSVVSTVSENFAPGTYLVSEGSVNGYYGTYSGDCDPTSHLISGANGDVKICTITNTALAAQITLVKNVVGGSAIPTDFTMRVDGVPVATGGSTLVTANASHTITEDTVAGYVGTISGDAKCPGALGGTTTLNEGEYITCTITNTYTQ